MDSAEEAIADVIVDAVVVAVAIVGAAVVAAAAVAVPRTIKMFGRLARNLEDSSSGTFSFSVMERATALSRARVNDK